MRLTALTTGLISIALLALPAVVPVAAADGPSPGIAAPGPSPGLAASESGPKDYSKNSAGGDYVAPDAAAGAEAALRKRSIALNRALQSAPAAAPEQSQAEPGFAWDDAAIGAAVAVALIALLAAGVAVRRRVAAASPARMYGS